MVYYTFYKKHQLSSGTASLVLCTWKLQQGGWHPTLPDTSDLPSIVDGYAVFTSPDKADIIQLTIQPTKSKKEESEFQAAVLLVLAAV